MSEIKEKPILFLDLLNSFSSGELRGFRHFVSCKYFNTDRYAESLLTALCKHVLGKAAFDEQLQGLVFSEAFPDRPRSGKQLNTPEKQLLNMKLSALTRLAKRFLAIDALKDNAACESELLNGKLLEKQQYRILQRKLRKDDKSLQEQKTRGIDHYKYALQTESDKLKLLSRTRRLRNEDNLQVLMQKLDLFYLLNKHSLYLTMLSISKVAADRSFDLSAMKAIRPLSDLPAYARHPLLQLFRKTQALVTGNDPSVYFELLELLERYEAEIPRDNLISFYNSVLNYAAAQIRTGVLSYRDSFELYKMLEGKDLLLEQGGMPLQKIKNIVTASCRVNEFDWAKSIVERYRSSIEHLVREDVCHFNYGAIAFYQNDYKTAIHHFIRVKRINPVWEINCKIMLLKSHYNLDKYHAEGSMIAFRTAEQYARNNRSLSAAQRTGFINFIMILRRIYHLRFNPDKSARPRIVKRIKEVKLISDRQWLLDKLEELQ